MKLLIGVVVALLCIQTIQASFFRLESQCQRDLRVRKTGVSRWFRQTFKPDHDIAHSHLTIIKEVCDQLTKALEAYSATTPTAAEIAEFFIAFFQLHLKAVNAITQLRYFCDVLLNLSDEYKCSRQLACDKSLTLSGCEAQTNIEICDQLAFHDGLTLLAAQTKTLLDELLESCDDLYEQARSTDCQNRANGNECGAGQSGSVDVVSNFETIFLPSFIARHDIAHEELNGIDDICKLLSKAIDEWINRK
ncbi:uncharacterized protein LOC119066598 [Bradysia coprophila]|uniref:uncharacterized protein LOC119066598 n=1 Tax=Bradysia coprophila TaxID=38358 RepID=UPI00187D92D5|nr:uncharacterized protein LOC119066598 [Bradysia coprophila]